MKQQRITIFLIKSSVKIFENCLKEDDDIEEFEIKKEFRGNAAFYFKQQRSKTLPWLPFVKNFSHVEKKLEDQLSFYAAGVLFLRANRRIFAIAFGGGRHLLEPGTCETDFGLKVALNSVDPKKLRSLDAHSLDDSLLQKRLQVASKSGVEAFGINVEKDLLRALVGQPADETFGSLVAGRESLMLVTRILPMQLKDKCNTAFNYYQSEKYKEDFEWVDDLKPVIDPILEKSLDELVLESLKSEDDTIRIFPSDIIDFYHGVEFKFGFQRPNDTDVYFDLEIEDFYEKAEDLQSWGLEKLYSAKIKGRNSNSNNWSHEWRLYDCLSKELNHGGNQFVLHLSKWYQVSSYLASRVRAHTKKIFSANHNLPKYKKTDSEGKYNKRVGGQVHANETFVLFDRKLVKVEEASTHVEPCDLYSSDKCIYHLKKGHRSSSLSHLFSQGYVSAVCLLDSQKFRDHFNKKIGTAINNHTIPNSPNPADYTLFYGIMTPSKKPIEEIVPFFSQLTLSQITKELKRLKYKVKLIKIEQA